MNLYANRGNLNNTIIFVVLHGNPVLNCIILFTKQIDRG